MRRRSLHRRPSQKLHEKLKSRIKADAPEVVAPAGADRPLNLLERLDEQTSRIVAAAAGDA